MGVDMLSEYQQIMEDEYWRLDGEQNGWILPKVAWPWRIWGIRHLRATWHAVWTQHTASQWAASGVGTGHVNQYDVWRLYAIYRGWA